MLQVIKKTYDEYWGCYWRITSRHKIPGIFDWDRRLVNLIAEKCGLLPGMKVLDLGCAGGDQAKIFAEKGYWITGIDKVPGLIEYARDAFDKKGLAGTFLCDDMRNIGYADAFDLCVLLSGSFGFFTEEGNLQLLQKIHQALKKGGKLFIMYLSANRYSCIKRERTWKEIEEGYALSEQWYDTIANTYCARTKHILNNGTVIEPADENDYHANEIIRCYTVPEMERILETAGFRTLEHLSRKHIDAPDAVLAEADPRDIVIAGR